MVMKEVERREKSFLLFSMSHLAQLFQKWGFPEVAEMDTNKWVCRNSPK